MTVFRSLKTTLKPKTSQKARPHNINSETLKSLYKLDKRIRDRQAVTKQFICEEHTTMIQLKTMQIKQNFE